MHRAFAGAIAAVMLAALTTATMAQPASAAAACGAHHVAHDVNGDGLPDYVYLSGGSLYEWFGDAANNGFAPGPTEVGWTPPAHADAIVTADFDGDGCGDVAIGAVGSDGLTASTCAVGQVWIIFGSPTGLDPDRTVQLAPGNGYRTCEAGFGAALAAGDFSGDHLADLAIGDVDPGGNFIGGGWVDEYTAHAGGVPTFRKAWHQGTGQASGVAETGDRFGAALAAGDFDGDGKVDLAIGVPGEALGTTTDAGVVDVFYGATGGLTASRARGFDQDSAGIADTAERGDQFGAALAAADFSGDGRADLAIGVPGESVGSATGAGLVNVVYGSKSGLTSTGNQGWTQNTPNVSGSSESGDHFGAALAAGNITGSSAADLAVGVPGETVNDQTHGGMINMILGGGAHGLTAAGNFAITTISAGEPNGVMSFARQLVIVPAGGGLVPVLLVASDWPSRGFDFLVAQPNPLPARSRFGTVVDAGLILG
jgi:hypothetical protein